MWSLLDFFKEPFQINVLDIGAALSERPKYQPLIDRGRARLIGFEPHPQERERLQASYGTPHLFLPYFVGDGRAATYHETNLSLTGSLFEPNISLLEKFQNLAEVTTVVAKHAIETHRLDDIAEIDDVDFIKIDVQGSELPIFENATRVLSGVLAIHTEVEFVEMYKRQPMFADVDRFLRANGFQFHAFDGFGGRMFKPLVVDNDVNAGLRQSLWADAIYVRDWMQIDALSVEKLRNYAVLAHDVLESYDLAHFVLAALDKKAGSALAPAYLQRLIQPPQPSSR